LKLIKSPDKLIDYITWRHFSKSRCFAIECISCTLSSMDKFHCRICKKDFSTASGLTRHANAMHHGKTSLSQGSRSQQQIQSPEHDSDLWSMPIIRPSESGSPTFAETPMLQVDMEDVIDESELHDHLRSQENEESIEDINEELQTNLEDTDSDSEDL